MKKLIVLICAAFLTVSVIGQNVKNHAGFFSKISKQKELSVPGINHNFMQFQSQNTSSNQLPHLKESNALKQRLDSVVAPGYDKDEYFPEFLYRENSSEVENIYI